MYLTQNASPLADLSLIIELVEACMVHSGETVVRDNIS